VYIRVFYITVFGSDVGQSCLVVRVHPHQGQPSSAVMLSDSNRARRVPSHLLRCYGAHAAPICTHILCPKHICAASIKEDIVLVVMEQPFAEANFPVSEHAVLRQLLDRVLTMECAMATMAEEHKHTASMQLEQSTILHDVRQSVFDVVHTQRQMCAVLCGSTPSQPYACAQPQSAIAGPISGHNPHADSSSSHNSQSKSPESLVQLCPFPECSVATHKSCTATQSCRHMQVCQFCPTEDTRYLLIAQHMQLFQQNPRVTSVNVCCWCGGKWLDAASPDARSRHRGVCHHKVIVALQDPNRREQVSKDLTAAWTEKSLSPCKRLRGIADPHAPFSPPISGIEAWSTTNAAESDLLVDGGFLNL